MARTSRKRMPAGDDVAEAAALLCPAEAAARLGVSTRTLRRWELAGRLRVVRLTPRTVRVAATEISRLIDAA